LGPEQFRTFFADLQIKLLETENSSNLATRALLRTRSTPEL